MKKTILSVVAVMLLSGCENGSPIDLSFLFPQDPPNDLCVPVPCEDSFSGMIQEVSDRIDTNTVKMEHYVDEILLDENVATLEIRDGKVSTVNNIIIPSYKGIPMRHILVVEFMQVN